MISTAKYGSIVPMKKFVSKIIIISNVFLFGCTGSSINEVNDKIHDSGYANFRNNIENIDPIYISLSWSDDSSGEYKNVISSYDLEWDVDFCDQDEVVLCIDAPFDFIIPKKLTNRFSYKNSRGETVLLLINKNDSECKSICDCSNLKISTYNETTNRNGVFTFNKIQGLTYFQVEKSGEYYFNHSLISGGVLGLVDYCS